MKSEIKKLSYLIRKVQKGKIYFFGAGKIGRRAKEQLSEYSVSLEAFIDNNESLNDAYIDGIVIKNADWLKKYIENEDVVVITTVYRKEILKQLEDLKIKNYIEYDEKLFAYAYQYYDFLIDGYMPAFERAILWVNNHYIINEGIAYGSINSVSYPEVSGYFIPTLMDYGMEEICIKIARWLLSVQQEDGGFQGPERSEKEYVFDTGQVLRGFLRMRFVESIKTDVIEGIKKCCEFLYRHMQMNGKKGFCPQYDGHERPAIPETILLYVLPPLKEAAEILNRKDILEGVSNCLTYYKAHEDLLNLSYISHFTGYEMEALIDLGETECVESLISYYEKMMMDFGYIKAAKGVDWICTPGMIQIGICFYKTGKIEWGDKIIHKIEDMQCDTGGFYGSYGEGAAYLENEDISWAVKFYLDANKLRIKGHFYSTADDETIYPLMMDKKDPRYVFIEKHIGNGKKIVEVGCGNGRILKNIMQDFKEVQLYGLDISEKMIEKLPEGIIGIQDEMEHISLESEFCDVVLCVEALEHSVNKEQAIKEMQRILKTEGVLIIIDKNKDNWGRMQCQRWEDWLDEEIMIQILNKYFKKVDFLSIDSSTEVNDGLYLGIAAFK